MKELDFIEIIKQQVNDSYIGDDCAYLEDLGIVVTQDNFVENIHFRTDWATPFQIGYKATAVNISDILAAGAKPAYITVGLALPSYIDKAFVEELYKGINAGLYGAKIIGGDITGGESIMISITAIGTTKGRSISSRSAAKSGQVVITNKPHGQSLLGLKELINKGNNQDLITAHLEPVLDVEFSERISTRINTKYAMMDSSDGLADALFKIAKASNVKIVADLVDGMFGAEDYNLVAVLPKEFLLNLDNYIVVGEVVPFDGYFVKIGDREYKTYDELGLYDHFGD